MGTLFYLLLIFLFIKLIQYVIKKAKEQSEAQNYEAPKQIFPQQQTKTSSYNSLYSDDEVFESSLGFYSFGTDDDKEEFYFKVNDKNYTFAYRNLLDYEVKTRNDAVITIELKTNRPGLAFLEIECFSKQKAVGLLPEDERRPLPLHRLYEEELETAEEIGEVLEDILEDNKDYEEEEIKVEETPPPVPVIVMEEKTEDKKEETVVDNTLSLFDIIESIEAKKEVMSENIISEPVEQYPSIEEQISEPEPEIYKPLEEQPYIVEEITDDDLVRISLSDVDYYSYGKFLDSEVQSAVGDAKMRGKKEIFITKEQLEKLKQ